MISCTLDDNLNPLDYFVYDALILILRLAEDVILFALLNKGIGRFASVFPASLLFFGRL